VRASLETPAPDERDLRFDAAATQFAAPLARLARSLEDEQPGRATLRDDLHLALWHSLADYDEGTPLRTWVFREALQSIATHEPNSQDKDDRNLPIKVVWGQRRMLRAQRWLAEIPAPVPSATDLLRSLKPMDREPVILFLESIDVDEAARITGWPVARMQQAYEKIAGLLPQEAREEWQRQDADAEPVTRGLIRLRSDELIKRKARETRAQFLNSLVISAVLVVHALTFYRGHWLMLTGMAIFTGLLVHEGMQARRKPQDPAMRRTGHSNSRSFHRELLSKQRDDLQSGYSWQSWVSLVALFMVILGYPLITPRALPFAVASFAVIGLVMGVTRYRNLREARRLQARLEAL
jgi:RNA polymerase sigma-70 factor (ECF subfamily)